MTTSFIRINCRNCETVEIPAPRRGITTIRCLTCNAPYRIEQGKRIRITASAHDCTRDCTHAKGDTCACECGGKCHGLGFCDPASHKSKLEVAC